MTFDAKHDNASRTCVSRVTRNEATLPFGMTIWLFTWFKTPPAKADWKGNK